MNHLPVRSLLLLAFTALAIASCAPSDQQLLDAIQATLAEWTPIPSQTPYPTLTPQPTVVVEVTRLIAVTTTSTAIPLFTPTITPTPTKTPPPTSTLIPTRTPNLTQTSQALAQESLRRDKGSGFYLVNVDIAPGVWRSNGTGDACYWATTTSTGGIIDNHFGMAGGTAYISPNAFQVEFNDCGVWTFISPP